MRKWINLFEMDVEDEIDAIAKRWGVVLDAELVDQVIRLYHFERPPTSAPGSGAKAIQELASLGYDIRLTVADADEEPGLVAYYQRLGFRIVGGPDNEPEMLLRV